MFLPLFASELEFLIIKQQADDLLPNKDLDPARFAAVSGHVPDCIDSLAALPQL